ncbi:MAG: amino acid permease [Myxococcaceae bacterium]|nr:amino acid permease [Myxococcaceae bacterium]
MSGFSNFALSFSIISVLTGAITLFGHGLTWGGPLEMTLGWPVVALGTVPVALSLAELSSAFPTAGALYHWSALLGGKRLGWFTAWLNVVGQFAITAGIDYGLCELLAPALGLPKDRALVLGLYAVVLLSHGALNHLGVQLVARLNTVSAWYHVVGVVVLAVALVAFAPHQSAAFLLETGAAPQGLAWLGFLVGMLQGAWTFTGYDASAHAVEETKDPALNAPRGIVLSVVSSAVAGWVLLLAVTWAVPSLEGAKAADNAFLFVLHRSLGRVGDVLVWLVLGAMWFCGLASVTSNSRMLYAFARDGGVPFSAALQRVSPRFKSPSVAVWVSVGMALLVAVWADAYSAMVALSTVALYGSYALPIAAGARARDEGRWTVRGPWHLGRWSKALNAVAVLWLCALMVLMVVPPNELAGVTLVGVLVALVVGWQVVGARFRGPPVSLEAFQRPVP